MSSKAVLLNSCLAVILVSSSFAQSVALPNLLDPAPGGFNPVIPTASSVYSGSFPVTNVNNGVSSIFVFGNSDTTTPALNFTGFNSSIDSLEFYDSNYADRVAPSVSIYFSLAGTNSLLTNNYTRVGSAPFTLNYTGTTTGASNLIGGHQITYATVSNLGIPPGTQSILLVFGATGGSSSSFNSYGISEIEAFASACPSPTQPAAVAGDKQVTVNWTAPLGGSSSYNLKRSVTQGSGYATIDNTTATTVVDTNVINGTIYYYVVTSVNASCESGNSSEVSATPNPAIGSLSFVQQPGSTNSGKVISPAVVVAVKDAGNNPITNVLVNIGLTNGVSMGGTAAQLSSNSGFATFPGLFITTVGNGYSLQATAGSVSVDSSPFNILPVMDGSIGDGNINYFGRWDFTSPTQFVSYWGGAYIKANFSGTSVKIKLGNKSNYHVKIDNGSWITYSNASGTVNLTPTPLSDGIHSLSVAQGQDYAYVFNFQGLILDAGATTTPPVACPNLMEFIGDSITCGYTDPQANVSDYSWVCSENLNCEHTQIAYPGIALVNGYGINSVKTGMDLQYFKSQNLAYTSSPNWDFSRYTPRAVVINLGQNDYTVGVPDGVFQSDYTNFLANVRMKFPNAEIFVMRPFSGAKSAPTLAAVNARISAGDGHVHYIDTTGWLNAGDLNDGLHPSVSGQIKAAAYLLPILRPYVTPVILNCSVDASGSFNVFWPTSAVSFLLQVTTNLSPPVVWSSATNSILIQAGTNWSTIVPDSGVHLFRLMQQ